MRRAAALAAFLTFLLSFSSAWAVVTLSETTIEQYRPAAYLSGVYGHPGEICIACHTRFSKERSYASQLPHVVSNNAVLHIFPCSKAACHRTPPTKFAPIGKTRWKLHMGICENCHPRWSTGFETIHNTHLNFTYLMINRSGVSCELCHARPQGYNSSIVRVPPWPSGEAEFTGKVVKPDWKGDCAYCHFTIKDAERVHDVHEPVLLKACPICHSPYILKSRKMFRRIGYPYPFEKEERTGIGERLAETTPANASIITPARTPPPAAAKPLPVLAEFYLYFNEIVRRLQDIFARVV